MMKQRIDYKNKNTIRERIYAHDGIFTGFNYEYENNLIYFEIQRNFYGKNFKLLFNNVFGFEMQSCDFWSNSPHVFDLELGDSYGNKMTKMLLERHESEKKSCSRLTKYDEAVEIIITLTSGDKLTLVCEYIEYEEKDSI